MKPQEASIVHADLRLEDLKQRFRNLEDARAVVTVRTRPNKKPI